MNKKTVRSRVRSWRLRRSERVVGTADPVAVVVWSNGRVGVTESWNEYVTMLRFRGRLHEWAGDDVVNRIGRAVHRWLEHRYHADPPVDFWYGGGR